MSLKKIILGLSLIFCTTAFSQKWVEKQTNAMLTKIETRLAKAELTLTEEQKEKITTIYKELVVYKGGVAKEMKAEGTYTKEAHYEVVREKTKTAHKAVRELLTKEQRQANRK